MRRKTSKKNTRNKQHWVCFKLGFICTIWFPFFFASLKLARDREWLIPNPTSLEWPRKGTPGNRWETELKGPRCKATRRLAVHLHWPAKIRVYPFRSGFTHAWCLCKHAFQSVHECMKAVVVQFAYVKSCSEVGFFFRWLRSCCDLNVSQLG